MRLPPKDTYARRALDYAKAVTAGKIAACWQIRAACQRTLDDFERKDLIFDQARIDHVCAFIETLVHIKGQWARTPIRLEPFQVWILASLFGFIYRDTRLRKYTDAFVLLPRKNGKSLLAAGIALYMAFADDEAGAEIYIGASNKEQANEVFTPAKRMAELTPGFLEAYDVEVMAESIFCVTTGQSIRKVIGNAKDGASVHLAIADEVHQHREATQVNAFRTGRGARLQPLLLMISTAGHNLAGVCRTEQLSAESMLKGEKTSDNIFAAIWTLDEADDWRDFANWRKANPNFGVSINEKFLRDEHQEALQTPAKQASARTRYLNQWVGSAYGWLNMVDWSKCADKSLDIQDLKGSTAWLGIDLSTRQDLTAIIAVVRLPNGKFAIFPFLLAPEGAIEGSPNAPAYAGWVDGGHLIASEGTASSFKEAEAQIEWLMSHFTIAEAVFDPWQAEDMRQRLEAKGLNTSIWAASNRSLWTRVMDDFEADLKNGQIVHPANPVLDWNAANICAKAQGVTRVPVKPHNDKKIDGIVAALMAYAASQVAVVEEVPFEAMWF